MSSVERNGRFNAARKRGMCLASVLGVNKEKEMVVTLVMSAVGAVLLVIVAIPAADSNRSGKRQPLPRKNTDSAAAYHTAACDSVCEEAEAIADSYFARFHLS